MNQFKPIFLGQVSNPAPARLARLARPPASQAQPSGGRAAWPGVA